MRPRPPQTPRRGGHPPRPIIDSILAEPVSLNSAPISLQDHKEKIISSSNTVNPRFRATSPRNSHTISFRRNPILPDGARIPKEVINDYYFFLSSYELTEILEFQDVYYVGKRSNKITPNFSNMHNFGFDDISDNLLINIGDHVQYRYEIKAILSEGEHGSIVLCEDHKLKENKVIKIYSRQENAMVQAKFIIKSFFDPKRRRCNMANIIGFFVWRNHICICYEVLGSPVSILADKEEDCQTPEFIKSVGKSLFSALKELHSMGLVHGKVNARNILVDPYCIGSFKICDFDSLRKEKEIPLFKGKRVIERSPEELFDTQIGGAKSDIWCAALTLYDIISGGPLFRGRTPVDVIRNIWALIELPPERYLKTKIGRKVFDEDGALILSEDDPPVYARKFENLTCDQCLNDLLKQCIKWEPRDRPTAEEILRHPFFTRTVLQPSQHVSESLPKLKK